MSNAINYKEMEIEVTEYFANLTEEQFIKDLELADYSFYEDITVKFLGGLETTQITYGQIKISSSVSKFIEPEVGHSYRIPDFSVADNYDYALAA
jgi:hypothetical protein